MDLYRSGDNLKFWSKYVKSRMSAEDKKAYEAHKSGTMKLQPFYDFAMDDLGDAFYEKLSGEKAFTLRGIGSYKNLKTTQAGLMFDGDSITHYTSGEAQKAGDWMGVALPEPMAVREVHILQGRNSTDDCDFYDHAALEYSVDGKTWNTMLGDMKNQYDILWQGEPVQARYIRLRRLDSDRKNWASIRSFVVVPAGAASLEFENSKAGASDVLLAFDHQPGTSFKNTGAVSFEVPSGMTSYTFMLSLPEGGSVRICQYDKRNKLKAEFTSNEPFFTVDVAKKVTRMELIGKAEVFEIIPKK